MYDLICLGLVDLWGKRSKRELQNEKMVLEPTILRLEDRGSYSVSNWGIQTQQFLRYVQKYF